MDQQVGGPVSAGVGFSPEQRAWWAMFEQQGVTHPGQAVHVALAEVDGPLNEALLREAVTAVVCRHEALRQRLAQVPGYLGWRQFETLEAPPLRWQCVDLRAVVGEARAAWSRAFAHEPLAVEQGEVLRVGLARTADGRWTLAVAACALLVDRGSLQALIEQIMAIPAGMPLDDEVFEHGQFLAWRQDLAQDDGPEARQAREHWSAALPPVAEQQALAWSRQPTGEVLEADATPKPRAQSSRALTPALVAGISGLASSQGLRIDTVLQAAWWLLLSRLGGHERFMAGWQHDCRLDYDVMQGAVGVFDKVLPWFIDVSGDERLDDWLSRFGQAAEHHVQAQEYWPVEAPPATAHLALGFCFDAATREAPGQADQAGWRMRAWPAPWPGFELALQVTWRQHSAELTVHLDTSRGKRWSAAHLLAQYATLLEGMVSAQPSVPVSSLPLVGPAEQEALLARQGQTRDFGTATVTEHIAQWAARTPDAPAVESGHRRLSYAELLSQADALAGWMKHQGVGPGTLVALNLPRSIDLLTGVLAAWRLGAGYLCLEPEWPSARRQAVLDDARPALVIDGPVDIGAHHPIQTAHAGGLQDVAYVLYTSGSTGVPKGVVIEQGQLLNYVAGASQAMGLDQVRRWALTGSVAADLGNTALFGALFNGACLVIADQADMRDGQAFARFMAEHRIDGLKIVPSHLDALLDADRPVLPAKLVLGGEPVPGALIERITRLSSTTDTFNHYGPTEGTVGVMVHAVQAGQQAQALPLSTVLPNNRVLVLDPAMRLTPMGALGEVYIGGPQLCRGYLNRSVEGAFVVDPFLPRERLYRTGDLAVVLPEGGIQLAGRADLQVKVRGFRVEPAEVESALLAEPCVRLAVVLGFSTEGAGVELVAFVVADEPMSAPRALVALRERLGQVLPAHMVPSRLIGLSELPRLANGKIDRRTLTALATQAVADADPSRHIAPRDAVESVIADAIAYLLGRESISMHEDFFDLGGHSLLVIKLVARLRKLLKVDIAPGVVFDHPTVPALAQAVREAAPDADQLLKLAELQRQLASLSPQQRAALTQRA